METWRDLAEILLPDLPEPCAVSNRGLQVISKKNSVSIRAKLRGKRFVCMSNRKSRTPNENGKAESLPWPDQFISDQPTKAAATAAGVGFLLTFLPLGKIAGVFIDLAFSLARPLLLCFGLVKLLESCQSEGLCGGESEKTKTNKQ